LVSLRDEGSPKSAGAKGSDLCFGIGLLWEQVLGPVILFICEGLVMSIPKKKSMFGKPKNMTLAKKIEMDTPTHARKAAAEMVKRFHELEHRDAKVATKRAVVNAANRAGATLNRKNLSTKEKKEMRKIRRIYKDAAKKMVL
jgi:hypothetical protein